MKRVKKKILKKKRGSRQVLASEASAGLSLPLSPKTSPEAESQKGEKRKKRLKKKNTNADPKQHRHPGQNTCLTDERKQQLRIQIENLNKQKAEKEQQLQEQALHMDRQRSPELQRRSEDQRRKPKTQEYLAAKAALTVEAVAAIMKGIADGKAQANGHCYWPPDWCFKYKPVLGHYKKFLKSVPDKLTVVDLKEGRYIVKLVGASTPQYTEGGGTDWAKALNKAWRQYCKHTRENPPSIERLMKFIKNDQLASTTTSM